MSVTLQGFYSVTAVRQDDTVAEVEVRISPDHPVYGGHFPDQPVAPGAALTQMVLDEAERLLGGGRSLAVARQIKFLAVIDPRVVGTILLRYQFVHQDDGVQFTCAGSDASTVYFKINGILR